MGAYCSAPQPPMSFSPSPALPSGDTSILWVKFAGSAVGPTHRGCAGAHTPPPHTPHVPAARMGEWRPRERDWSTCGHPKFGSEEHLAPWGWGGLGPQCRVRCFHPLPFPTPALGIPFAPRARPGVLGPRESPSPPPPLLTERRRRHSAGQQRSGAGARETLMRSSSSGSTARGGGVPREVGWGGGVPASLLRASSPPSVGTPPVTSLYSAAAAYC